MHSGYIYGRGSLFVHSAYKFTGKERDTESGNDYFGARYYSSSMGRWMSPDWADRPSPVPWAVFSDPQSLNLYSYVRNNPLSHTDPNGHERCADGKEADACVTAQPYGPITTFVLNAAAATQRQVQNIQQRVQALPLMQSVNKHLDSKSIQNAQFAGLLANLLMRDLGLTSDEIEDLTIGKSVDNAGVKLTPDQVGAKLQDNGYTQKSASDGTPTYTNKTTQTQYTIYSNAKSTDGPTAQVKENGSVVGKVRLK